MGASRARAVASFLGKWSQVAAPRSRERARRRRAKGILMGGRFIRANAFGRRIGRAGLRVVDRHF